MLDNGGKDAGPTGAGEAVGEITLPVPMTVVPAGVEEDAVCSKAPPVDDEDEVFDIPIPMFASWEELAIAIGKVGLC